MFTLEKIYVKTMIILTYDHPIAHPLTYIYSTYQRYSVNALKTVQI